MNDAEILIASGNMEPEMTVGLDFASVRGISVLLFCEIGCRCCLEQEDVNISRVRAIYRQNSGIR